MVDEASFHNFFISLFFTRLVSKKINKSPSRREVTRSSFINYRRIRGASREHRALLFSPTVYYLLSSLARILEGHEDSPRHGRELLSGLQDQERYPIELGAFVTPETISIVRRSLLKNAATGNSAAYRRRKKVL